MNNYYKPSGRFSPVSLIYFLLLSLSALPVLGLIYTYCIWYIPFIYINFFIAAGFGFVVGLIINIVVIGKGKVRNVTLSLILGLLGGFIALYFHWAVWVDLVINAGESYGNSQVGVTVSNIKILQVFFLAADPGTLFGMIKEINEFGTWGIRGATVSGTFLSVIWIIELIIIVGIATIITFPRSKKPFCEMGNNWFDETVLPAFNFIEDKAKMIAELEKANNNFLDNLVGVTNLEQDHSVFTLYTSRHNENYLSIENKKAKEDDKGKLSFDTDEFLEYISINTSLKAILLGKSASSGADVVLQEELPESP